MSEKLSKDVVSEHIDYVFKECRICAEHHNYDCVDCPHFKKCYQVHEQLKSLIKAQAEPSEAELEEFMGKKAMELYRWILRSPKESRDFVRQMLKEYRELLRRGRWSI